MLDVKAWLNTNTANIPFVKVAKKQPSQSIYGVFVDDIQRRGSDLGEVKLYQHNISVAIYSEAIDADAEEAMEALFDEKNVDWLKNREFVEEDKNFETLWSFSILDKE